MFIAPSSSPCLPLFHIPINLAEVGEVNSISASCLFDCVDVYTSIVSLLPLPISPSFPSSPLRFSSSHYSVTLAYCRTVDLARHCIASIQFDCRCASNHVLLSNCIRNTVIILPNTVRNAQIHFRLP